MWYATLFSCASWVFMCRDVLISMTGELCLISEFVFLKIFLSTFRILMEKMFLSANSRAKLC